MMTTLLCMFLVPLLLTTAAGDADVVDFCFCSAVLAAREMPTPPERKVKMRRLNVEENTLAAGCGAIASATDDGFSAYFI